MPRQTPTTYQVARAVLLLEVGGLSTLAWGIVNITLAIHRLFNSHTCTGRTHQNDAHLLSDGLGLSAIGETALELGHLSLQLVNGVLQAGNGLFGDGSHCRLERRG